MSTMFSDAYRKSPYVGYFSSSHERRNRPSFFLPRNIISSPYLGVFRHAPPEWETIDNSITREKKSFDGRLPGGGHESSKIEEQVNCPYGFYPPLTWLDRKASDSILLATSSSSSSALQRKKFAAFDVVNRCFHIMLRRVLLLDNGEEKSDDEEDSSSSDEDEHDDPEEKSQNVAQQDEMRPTLDISCAYQDAAMLREARLDYVITQVDISRMAKNASRHLDVESILALPTITFRAEQQQEQQEEEEDQQNRITAREVGRQENVVSSSTFLEGWSWQMVTPPHDEEEDKEDEAKEENKNEESTPPIEQDNHIQSCVICIEAFQDGDALRVLPCGHLFHIGCIDHWLLGTYSDDECFTTGCPTCKKHPLVEKEHHAETNASPPDGSVPSWAFARLGGVLAKDMAMESQRESGDCPPSNEVTISQDPSELDASALSVSGIVSTASDSSKSL